MNDGFRRFLVLVLVFVLAYLAVSIALKLQKREPQGIDQNGQVTLRLNPVIPPSQVQILDAINRESAALVEAVVPSVVSINTHGKRRVRIRDILGRAWSYSEPIQGQGSGVIVSKEGHVLTNEHVVRGYASIRLTMHDGTEHSARVIGTDTAADIAVLKIDGDGQFQALKFGDSSPDNLKVGHAVFAIGNPFGIGKSVTEGIISAIERPVSDSQVPLLQTSAPINPGNSGGPLVNIRGEIIGINARIYSSDQDNAGWQGIGFAIPSNDARRTMEAILSKKPPGFLGLALQDINTSVGVRVVYLAPNSPAVKAGLEIDDIIISYQSETIQSMNQLINLIQRSEIDGLVTLEVLRKGAKLTLKATIGNADAFRLQQPSP